VNEWVMFNIPLDTLQIISETVLQAITCIGTDYRQQKLTAKTNEANTKIQ